MARYIDADKLREYWLENGVNACVYDTNTVLDSIDYQTTADVVEVKYGYWIEVSHIGNSKKGRHIKYTTKKCSVCGYCNGIRKTKRCPNCGAKMDGRSDT